MKGRVCPQSSVHLIGPSDHCIWQKCVLLLTSFVAGKLWFVECGWRWAECAQSLLMSDGDDRREYHEQVVPKESY